MTRGPRLGHLVLGPSAHGVTKYGERVHRALTDNGYDAHDVLRVGDIADATTALRTADFDVLHVHVTDRLFGDSPREAAAQFDSIADAAGVPVTTTLHDLPQPSDGPGMAERAECYRAVARRAAATVVSSDHEAALVREFVDERATVSVVPLLIEPVVRGGPEELENAVAVLGFLYPGKGHVETLRAMAGLDPSVAFVALGTPSPGHDDLIDELHSIAAESGRKCEITGYLDDDALDRRVRAIAVPVAHHRHMSASGSIGTWIAAGRRPAVPSTRYTEELQQRSPGVVRIHDDTDDALAVAIRAGLDDCLSTLLDPDVEPRPTPRDVAQQYDRIMREQA